MSDQYYIHLNNQQEGPFTAEQIRSMIADRTVSEITLVWQEGMPEWAPLNTVFSSAPAQPAPRSVAIGAQPSPRSRATRPARKAPSRARPTYSDGPSGVGGWLVFFCVGLTILGPIFTVGQTALAWDMAQPAFNRFPELKSAVVFENFASMSLVAYGLIAGIMIWSGSANGRGIARTYLVIRLFGFIVFEVITIFKMGDLPSEVMEVMVGGVVGAGVREFFYFLIWFLYFNKSKRVQNTYGYE